MQTLKLDDDLLALAHEGIKSATARRGRRDIELGPLQLEATNGEVAPLLVRVKSVTFVRLGDVSRTDIRREGYDNFGEMLESLRRFYPDCDVEDEFTLITWHKNKWKGVHNGR